MLEHVVQDAGTEQPEPVGVHDGLGRRLRGQYAVAEQLEEDLLLVGGSTVEEPLALLGVEHVCRHVAAGRVRLEQKGHVVLALLVRERCQFVHVALHVGVCCVPAARAVAR
jgi:hypothetical protein